MKKILCFFLPLFSTVAVAQSAYFGGSGPGERRTYKIDLGRIAVGDLAFSVEQKLNLRSSVELEVGPTFSQWYYTVYNKSAPYRMTQEGRTGYVFSIGYRYYVQTTKAIFDRFYFEPKLYYHKDLTHYTFVPPDTYTGPIPTIDGSRVQAQFLYNLGYQFRIKGRFLVDIYGGFGVGLLEARDPNYYFEDSQFKFSTILFKSYDIVTHYGLKIGFGSR